VARAEIFARLAAPKPLRDPDLTRRAFLRGSALTLLGLAAGPGAARALALAPRRLRMLHTHTGERIDVVYAEEGALLPDALRALDRFLRDHRTGDVHAIDPQVLDIAWSVARAVDRPAGEFEVICGYRSARSNEMLRTTGSGGVAKRSLHLSGRAIDLRLPGVDLRALRGAALALGRGGVGFYPASGFVHVDNGRPRAW
jgi:uncharacterized protein YcbK (DUF882 family)